ncbi:TetR/AcrR family transcriptional regulator [Flagellimonas flava]|uniref:Transcriptional regulator, TetR family n=1 Tax=Flagellimonas flava TaxID=570519 RepID=A0A1M5INS2_9FLAO|nr:TetR/AcrR family transcriptional regulator [Allomuricauda flava]SHG29600.1 transcriptional regulator, TetR family [Allomuricauda flava]
MINTTSKRAILLETSLELFVDQGIQKTSMALISEKSQVAVGTIYHHFKSKEELIEGVYLEILESLGKHIAFTHEEEQLDFKSRFDLLWRKGYDYYTQFPNRFRFHDTYSYSPLISNQLREYARGYYQVAFDLIQEGIREGMLINTNPVLIMRWLYNSLSTIIQIKLNHEFEVTEDMVSTTLEMAWKSLTYK